MTRVFEEGSTMSEACGTRCFGRLCCLAACCILSSAVPAFAHASDRGHVLLLPTGYYIAGGAFSVAGSFLILALLPPSALESAGRRRFGLFRLGEAGRTAASLFSFVLFLVLFFAGLFGSRDPLSNPLPLVIWTLLWVGLALAQGVLGDLWSWLNPWYGLCRLASRLGRPAMQMPAWLGLWPATVLFLAFNWFELVDPAPDDPARLAWAAALYWMLTFVAASLFGYEQWMQRGEFLSIFFRMVSQFSIVCRDEGGKVSLCWPGSKLLSVDPLSASGIAFLLLALSSVSFDGLSKTFVWLGYNGINPLEYPGRTALMTISTVGLLMMFAALAAIFLLAVFIGERLAEKGGRPLATAGTMVWSIVPIALAYHFAHYLTVLLVDSQYAVAALSDPFAFGWNLFGTANMQIEAGIVAGAQSAWWLWNCQAAVIIVGHILAVLVAHALAFKLYGDPRRATLSQLPLTLLMIFYTVFGLWLLAAPTAG